MVAIAISPDVTSRMEALRARNNGRRDVAVENGRQLKDHAEPVAFNGAHIAEKLSFLDLDQVKAALPQSPVAMQQEVSSHIDSPLGPQVARLLAKRASLSA